MSLKRRNFMKMVSAGALITTPLLHAASYPFAIGKETVDASPKGRSNMNNFNYADQIVIDGLIISRGWNDDSFEALAKSGYTGFNTSLDSKDLTSALESLAEWKSRIGDHPNRLMSARSAEDFITAKQENKVAVMFGFQNATMIEKSIDNLNTLYAEGTRWIQLTYNERNLLGDGCTERTNAGLSDFGIEAVQRMNELGIIVDLSHCGRQTTLDGIQFSKAGVSMNHTMCEALYKEHPRAKTDQQIRAMAEKGGVMGIICLGYMIGPDPGGQTTLETYIDHIDHAVNIAGIDHVGLAADFAIEGLEANGATRENWFVPRLSRFKPSYQVRWPPWIPELDRAERYQYVAKAMEKRGYKDEEIAKILGKNWLRYFNENLKSNL
jgi:membrane dipeptidase|tara:strand:- start:1098 stop:2240 length:1143 start_codon:yes stop_codon:yes gene_type:complete